MFKYFGRKRGNWFLWAGSAVVFVHVCFNARLKTLSGAKEARDAGETGMQRKFFEVQDLSSKAMLHVFQCH